MNESWWKQEEKNKQTIINSSLAPHRGTVEQTSIRIAEQFQWLFVSSFEADINLEQVLRYASEEGGIEKKCFCEKMKTNKLKCSFKLDVPRCVSIRIEMGSFLPEGPLCEPFSSQQYEIRDGAEMSEVQANSETCIKTLHNIVQSIRLCINNDCED